MATNKRRKADRWTAKDEVRAWAKVMGVSQSRVRQQMREANDLARARKNPNGWTVLRYPEDGSLRAYPRRMFEGAAA